MAQEAIQDFATPIFTKPLPLGANPDKWDEIEYKHKCNAVLKKRELWDKIKPKVYNLLLLHSTPMLKTALKGHTEWKAVSAAKDPIRLLEIMRNLIHQGVGTKGEAEKAVNNYLQMMCTHQPYSQDLDKFYKTFQANAAAIEAASSKPALDYGLWMSLVEKKRQESSIPAADPTPDDILQEALEESCEQFLSCLLIKLSSNAKYQALKVDLHNKSIGNKDAWPKTREEAYGLLQGFQAPPMAKPTRGQQVQFEIEAELNLAQIAQDTVCFGCGKKSNPPHTWRRCPELNQAQKDAIEAKIGNGKSTQDAVKEAVNNANVGEEEGFQECIDGINNMNVQGADKASIHSDDYEDFDCEDSVHFQQVGTKLKLKRKEICNRNRGYLDTGASQHSCCNLDLLANRHKAGTTLTQHCNAGVKYTSRMGWIGPFKMWENADGIANLISFSLCEAEGWEFAYQTGGCWVAYMPDGGRVDFLIETEGPCAGMPYLDLTRLDDHISYPVESVAMIETVQGNMEGFTLEEVNRARRARQALAMMGRPSERTLKQMVSSNVILDCDINPADLTIATALFGKARFKIPAKFRSEFRFRAKIRDFWSRSHRNHF
jgi:hypothetical protein